jgi:hypothetical protein
MMDQQIASRLGADLFLLHAPNPGHPGRPLIRFAGAGTCPAPGIR